MNAIVKPAAAPACRVMIVDDSVLMRRLMAEFLRQAQDCEVVAMATNGEEAIAALRATPADIIILDIEMPVMDGLAAIRHLKTIDPGVQIIMASTLTQRNAAISLQALAMGASDYIPKPLAAGQPVTEGGGFRRVLLEKVRELSKVARRNHVRMPGGVPALAGGTGDATSLTFRPMPTLPPAMIAIAASTGGPQALTYLIERLGPGLPTVLITQHMPAFFTASLAQNIAAQCYVGCSEAQDGEPLKRGGHYYVAPGDFHMTLGGRSDAPRISLDKSEPENFCRPSADPMLRSVAAIYGARALVLILTGLGQDGCAGSADIVKAGGAVLAQDEASSVVWGMPGAVARAGLCSAVLSLNGMAACVKKLCEGRRA